MSDNVFVKPVPGTTSVSVATDDIAGTHYPIYKISFGALGSQTPVDSDNPLPIAQISTVQSVSQQLQLDDIGVKFNGLLKELRIANIHLSIISNYEINSEEVET